MRNAGFYLGNMGGDLVEKRQISEKIFTLQHSVFWGNLDKEI